MLHASMTSYVAEVVDALLLQTPGQLLASIEMRLGIWHLWCADTVEAGSHVDITTGDLRQGNPVCPYAAGAKCVWYLSFSRVAI